MLVLQATYCGSHDIVAPRRNCHPSHREGSVVGSSPKTCRFLACPRLRLRTARYDKGEGKGECCLNYNETPNGKCA